MRVLMVEVTAARPVVACVVVDGKRQSVSTCPVCRGASIVVSTDVGWCHLICLAVPCLFGKVNPRSVFPDVLAMVEDDVGNETCAFATICGYHASEFPFGTEGTLLVEVVNRHVAHRVVAVAPTALWNPNQLEVGCNLVSFRLELCPGCLGIRIPIESLHHDPLVIIGPTL